MMKDLINQGKYIQYNSTAYLVAILKMLLQVFANFCKLFQIS